jgi:hypothetical protein
MGYIAAVKIQCIKQDNSLGHDDLEFKVDSTSVGLISIATGETKGLSGATPPAGEAKEAPDTTPLFDHAFVDAGQVLSVWVDHLVHSNDLLLQHRLTAADIHNGLHATSSASCDCSYVFDFTFESSVSTAQSPRPTNGTHHFPGVFSHLKLDRLSGDTR